GATEESQHQDSSRWRASVTLCEARTEMLVVRPATHPEIRACDERALAVRSMRVFDTRDKSGELSARRDVEFHVSVAEVSLDGIDGHEEFAAYFRICRALRDGPSHFSFSSREARPAKCCANPTPTGARRMRRGLSEQCARSDRCSGRVR